MSKAHYFYHAVYHRKICRIPFIFSLHIGHLAHMGICGISMGIPTDSHSHGNPEFDPLISIHRISLTRNIIAILFSSTALHELYIPVHN